jgi:hypothetical protein
MSVRIKLTNGELIVDVDPGEWHRAFSRAMQNDVPLEIESADGRVLGINPQQILYWEEAPEESVADSAAELETAGA